MKYQVQIGGDQVDCEVDLASWPDVRAVVAGTPMDMSLSEISTGIYWLSVGNRSIEAAVVSSGDGYRVRIGADTFLLSLVDGRRRLERIGSGTAHGSREIRAPMPGRVVEVIVNDGDTIESGQGLLVLEAMKMQNEMRSPCSGTVRSVRVQAGMSVNAGDLLATVE